MKINLFPFEEWESQEVRFRAVLGIEPAVRMGLAFDGVHALNELTRSLADLYPHKRSMAVLGAQPPPVKEIVAGLAGLGFHISELPVSFSNPDEAKLQMAWDTLKKDTLFVLTSALEPLTGAQYPYEWIRRNGPAKNIFSLIYFSPDALTRGMPTPASPYEGLVLDPLWGQSHGLAAVLRGERCQGEKMFWGRAHFSDAAVSSLQDALKESQNARSVEDPAFVQEFENKVTVQIGGVHLLSNQGPGIFSRFFDRAVLFVDGAHGDALVHELGKAGDVTYTGAACAWKSPHLNSWLPKMGFSEELVESSLIIPLETLKKKDFFARLAGAINSLRQISGFR